MSSNDCPRSGGRPRPRSGSSPAVFERGDVRAHRVAALVGSDETERGEDAGGRGHEHGVHSELVGERARVQRAGAAECDEREVARIEALLDGDDAERAHHLGVHDLDHRLGVETVERSARGARVELDSARQRRGSRPRRRFASVTVARSPPRP